MRQSPAFRRCQYGFLFFFFNDTATTEIYTLSLHDALPIWIKSATFEVDAPYAFGTLSVEAGTQDRKSTRLNSSHSSISYAVFCLKKKKAPSQFSFPTMPARLSRTSLPCRLFTELAFTDGPH